MTGHSLVPMAARRRGCRSTIWWYGYWSWHMWDKPAALNMLADLLFVAALLGVLYAG